MDEDYLEVTQACLKNGKPGSITSCPISLAAKAKFNCRCVIYFPTGEVWKLYVHRFDNILREGSNKIYKVVGGETFAEKFDKGEKVTPKKFKLIELENKLC